MGLPCWPGNHAESRPAASTWKLRRRTLHPRDPPRPPSPPARFPSPPARGPAPRPARHLVWWAEKAGAGGDPGKPPVRVVAGIRHWDAGNSAIRVKLIPGARTSLRLDVGSGVTTSAVAAVVKVPRSALVRAPVRTCSLTGSPGRPKTAPAWRSGPPGASAPNSSLARAQNHSAHRGCRLANRSELQRRKGRHHKVTYRDGRFPGRHGRAARARGRMAARPSPQRGAGGTHGPARPRPGQTRRQIPSRSAEFHFGGF
jgi:hypothetical protein